VLVLSRDDVIPLLRTVMVAPITSTVRGAPSEVVVGLDEGLKLRSASNLDHVQTVEQGRLTRYVGSVSPEIMGRVCAALAIATGCR
jgi:mRNA interferase MazF